MHCCFFKEEAGVEGEGAGRWGGKGGGFREWVGGGGGREPMENGEVAEMVMVKGKV
jgi:hypothetical protein